MQKTASLRNVCLAALAAAFVQHSQALVVPFIEDFETNNSNWMNGASASATWLSSGGVDGGGYITANITMIETTFGVITFRGNAASDASGDAFVGDWLAGGVTLFTTYVRHNAPTNIDIYARLDAGSGRAGSSVNFSVAPNTWTQLSVPIVESPTSFQTYGAGTFDTVFTNIQNIQVVLAPNSELVGQIYTVDLDQVSVVPEPGTLGLAAGAGLLFLGVRALRKRKK
jgi:hypothetical protein